MSTTYHAIAIVGCKVDKSKLFTTDLVRSCEHPIPVGGVKFCPECGKRTYKKTKKPIQDYDTDKETVCGKRVFGHYYDTNFVIIAEQCVAVDNYDGPLAKMLPITVTDTTTWENKLRAVLEPLGLWDDEQFGIWTMLYCS